MHDGGTASVGERFRAGDPDAFAAVHRDTARGIHDFLTRMVRDRAAAEDLTQATFLRAYERRATLQDADRVTGWLYAIARNLALDHLRRRRPVTSIEADGRGTTEASGEPGPEEVVLRDEAVALVWDAAASLEPRQAAVLDLSLRHGLGATDIAAALETTPEHAAVLVNRARSALGGAVRYLAVARRRGRCERLDALVPAGLRQLTPTQRSTVDHHLRRCETCRDTAAALTAPDALYAAVPLLALPLALERAPDLAAIGTAAAPSTAPARPSPSAADTTASPPARAAAVSGGSSTAGTVVALIALAVAVALAVAGIAVAVRSAPTPDAAPATSTTVAAGGGTGGSGAGGSAGTTKPTRPAGPSSAAPLVTNGSGHQAFLSIDAVIVATDGCDGAMFEAAPDPGGSLFLLGNVHLDGDRLTLDGTSATYTGELHEDGVLHLQTHDGGSVESTVDARLGTDGTVTGTWDDVFLGDCVLHATIRSGDAPTIAQLTS